MSVNKNFVVKHGLEVDTNLIVANSNTNRVGIATTNPNYTLHVNGGIGVTNVAVTGIATIKNLVLDGYVSIGGTTGKDKFYLTSTGAGVTWSRLTRNSLYSVAAPGQKEFYLTYSVGSAEVYVNGVRLAPDEFDATSGNVVILEDACFGGETVEILATDVIPTGSAAVSVGATVQKEGITVGSASSITTFNFTGAAVSVTSASAYGVDIAINAVSNPPGSTLYVAVNGSDGNSGTTLDFAKRTIKAAVGLATSGTTIKVLPGTYIEDNPITLPENVAIEGAELRNCIVTPQNPALDLFWVTNGTHLTDLSFQGQTATNDASVVAFKPLVGVASNRFFDAARIIRYNLEFIAAEATGYISSTAYQNPIVAINTSNYRNHIKSTCLAICHDIVRGGNSKCVGVGLSFYTGGVINAGIGTTTIDALRYAVGIAQSCINNVSWTGNYQNEFTQIKDVSIQADPVTGSNIDINSCANVVSALYSCVGVVTTIIGVGTTAVGTSFSLTYPGNAGIGTTNPNNIPSQGVGLVTKGPYIRNCTNFIPRSVGMRVDGFHAEPGDQIDIGVTGSMSVDSYTQYNQGGIGVEITNGAYAQLVSIFTICNDQAIVTKNGGQCDITNSNSSFGTKGLVSDGASNATSLSIYRYTGNVSISSTEGNNSVIISGVGTERPYSGQVVYFGELYYEVEGVTIINPGSGYVDPPTVIFPISPTGPLAIAAEAIAEITNGGVTAINMIGNGRNYRLSDAATVTFTAPPGVGTTASGILNLKPLYYQIRSATVPNAGISTVTLAQNLNNDVGVAMTAFLFRQSLQIVSSHSFEYIGAGNTIETARPSKGGVTIRENEVVKLNGGEIAYTSTDQDGNFAIGDGLIIDQATGTISGRSFERSLLNTVTPFIIALGAK